MKRTGYLIRWLLLLGLLAACAPAPLSQPEQEAAMATMVAGTLQAQVAPTDTSEPIDGEIQPQSAYGDCAHSGQLSVAYIKDGNVWLWVQGGARSQLTHEGDAFDLRLSGDGCLVAYAREVSNPAFDPDGFSQPETLAELWVVSSEGAAPQRLAGLDLFASLPALEGAATTLNEFAWQPGARRLAFSTRQAFMGPGLLASGDLFVVEIDPLDVVQLLPANQAGRFAFSPDGAQIAFAGANQAGVIRTDGSDHRAALVSYPTVITYSEYLYEPRLHWTPAGDLIFALPPEDMLAEPAEGVHPETTLWYLPLDGAAAFEAGAIQAVMFPLQEVAFSPDRGRIAYLRPLSSADPSERELVIALSNGREESAWFNYPDVLFGDWAPDNERFIFSYQDGGLRLMVSDVTGDLAAPLDLPGLAGAFAVDLAWAADDAIVMTLVLGGSAQLSWVGLDGGMEVIDLVGQPFVVFDAAH